MTVVFCRSNVVFSGMVLVVMICSISGRAKRCSAGGLNTPCIATTVMFGKAPTSRRAFAHVEMVLPVAMISSTMMGRLPSTEPTMAPTSTSSPCFPLRRLCITTIGTSSRFAYLSAAFHSLFSVCLQWLVVHAWPVQASRLSRRRTVAGTVRTRSQRHRTALAA
jgi:hypothetical protein